MGNYVLLDFSRYVNVHVFVRVYLFTWTRIFVYFLKSCVYMLWVCRACRRACVCPRLVDSNSIQYLNVWVNCILVILFLFDKDHAVFSCKFTFAHFPRFSPSRWKVICMKSTNMLINWRPWLHLRNTETVFLSLSLAYTYSSFMSKLHFRTGNTYVKTLNSSFYEF